MSSSRGSPPSKQARREDGEGEEGVSPEPDPQAGASGAAEGAHGASSEPQREPEPEIVAVVSRGRGGFRGPQPREAREPARELVTCPSNIVTTNVQDPGRFKLADVMANFVRVQPMQERYIYQYRIEFEPDVESQAARRRIFRDGTANIFSKRPGFDGMHDVYCSQKLEQKITKMNFEHPFDKTNVEMKIINVREVEWTSFEMMRNYNFHMKRYLHLLDFFQITNTGAWVHPDLATPIGDGRALYILRGYKTATNVYEGSKIMVNLEACHKLMQRKSVYEIMDEIRRRGSGNLRESIETAVIGKLVITNYNKRIYRIEGVRFDLKPTDTFKDKRDDSDISYIDYYRRRHNQIVREPKQPLLLVVPNNKRAQREVLEEGQQKEILLVPELCHITGLTEEQRVDNRLKMDLIRASQTSPAERVNQMRAFLAKFHANVEVCNLLKEWGYSYDKDPVKLKAHILPVTKIATKPDKEALQPVHPQTADFNVNDLAKVPTLENLIIVTTRIDLVNKQQIINNLRRGFDKINLRPVNVRQIDIREGDAPSHYISCLRALAGEPTAVVVVMHGQNKERYDSIKKVASVERGIITQVVTARLMLDQKKIAGASTKIAIQIAAKIGGEPWWSDIPIKGDMVCGYDTFRDTAKRGLNYGAFLASMNDHFSRWYSKVNSHDQADQISAQLADALTHSLHKYNEINGKYPARVFIYRDGAGEGQLATIFETELQKLIEALKLVSESIRLTMIIVNKRTGARFYMRNMGSFSNCPPGSVIDHTVTRQGRFDFYLISQSTRNGTVAPTYYNVIHDESNMKPEHHQMLAYKLSLMYYNWSGTVRVPAPCQYAYKLASLCGEHLHAPPNPSLNDRLHFL